MVCMRVAVHESDGNKENDEDDSDSYKQGIECWKSRNHGKTTEMTKTTGIRGENAGSPDNGLRNTRALTSSEECRFKGVVLLAVVVGLHI